MRLSLKFTVFAVILVASVFPSLLQAQPRLISYQGVASQSAQPLNGYHRLTINYYYDGSLVGSESDSAYMLNGVFNYVLGHRFPGGEFPESFTFTGEYFIGIQIDNGSELAPRSPLLSAPYALNAEKANGIEVSFIPKDSTIFPLPVEAGKISPLILPNYIRTINNQPPDQFGDFQAGVFNNAIGTAQLKDSSVTQSKIAKHSIGVAQLDPAVVVNPASSTTWTAPQAFSAGITAGQITIAGGHLVSHQVALPTMTVSNSSNITATQLLNETDVAGKIVLTTSSTANAGDYLQVNFANPYNTPPIMSLTPGEANSSANFSKFYIASSTTYFRLYLNAPITGTFLFYYTAIETQ